MFCSAKVHSVQFRTRRMGRIIIGSAETLRGNESKRKASCSLWFWPSTRTSSTVRTAYIARRHPSTPKELSRAVHNLRHPFCFVSHLSPKSPAARLCVHQPGDGRESKYRMHHPQRHDLVERLWIQLSPAISPRRQLHQARRLQGLRLIHTRAV